MSWAPLVSNKTVWPASHSIAIRGSTFFWSNGSPPVISTKGHPKLATRSLISFRDRKSTRLNSSHPSISYAVFCLKKKKKTNKPQTKKIQDDIDAQAKPFKAL